MYDKNEKLVCSCCGDIFEGRKPPDGINIICPECLKRSELSVINEGDDIPSEINNEMNGGGEDGGSK